MHLWALADVSVMPSVFPEAFGMVAGEAAGVWMPAARRQSLGMAAVAAGVAAEYTPEHRTLASFASGDVDDLTRKLAALLALPSRTGRRSRKERDARPSTSGAGKTSPLCYFRAVGEAQRLSSDEQLRLARQQYEDARDFTVAVEEFAILDPITLEMVGRFDDFFAPHRARSWRDTSSASSSPRGGGAHGPLRDVRRGGHDGRPAAPAGRARRPPRCFTRLDRNASVEPLAGAGDHRYAALPSRGGGPALRRVAQQHVRHPCPRRHSQRRDRAIAVRRGPKLSARAARAVRQLAVQRGAVHAPPLDTDADLHADVSALRRFPTPTGAGTSTNATYAFSTTPSRSSSTHRSGGVSAPTWRSDRGAQDLRRPARARRRPSGGLRVLPRRARRPRPRRGREAPLHPNRLIEENLWRAIRYGLGGVMIDLETGQVRPTRAPRGARGLDPAGRGRARRSGVHRHSSRTRHSARSHATSAARRSERSTRTRSSSPFMSEDQDRVARELADELRSSRSRRSSSERSSRSPKSGTAGWELTPETSSDRLEQTKLAIETMNALTPVLEHVVPAELIRDFNQSVANLKLAYAKATSRTRWIQKPDVGSFGGKRTAMQARRHRPEGLNEPCCHRWQELPGMLDKRGRSSAEAV